MLQHGSLLLGGSQRTVSKVTLGVAPPDGSIALAEVRGGPVGFEEVAVAVSEAARAWSAEWSAESVDSTAIAALAMAHADRFRSDEWTWRR